ncbi:MAG: hypothetical protein F6K10_28440 [Moorea sp. SIO2B7]|nr:hypothetical protein [Moorena sp. SIO2B7]
MKTIFIIILVLIPPLISLLIIRKAKQRWQARLRRIRSIRSWQQVEASSLSENNDSNLDIYSNFIGDSSCRFNAHSAYIRCAVNPDGPCENCIHYEKQI